MKKKNIRLVRPQKAPLFWGYTLCGRLYNNYIVCTAEHNYQTLSESLPYIPDDIANDTILFGPTNLKNMGLEEVTHWYRLRYDGGKVWVVERMCEEVERQHANGLAAR